MKTFEITVTTARGTHRFAGLYRSSMDATLAAMESLDENDPHGRVQVRPQ